MVRPVCLRGFKRGFKGFHLGFQGGSDSPLGIMCLYQIPQHRGWCGRVRMIPEWRDESCGLYWRLRLLFLPR